MRNVSSKQMPMKLPANYNGKKIAKPVGAKGDNSNKKLATPSASAMGKGSVGKATIAASPKVPTRPTSSAGTAGSPKSKAARNARLAKAGY